MDPERLSYIINEFAENRESYFNAVAPPIVQTSNFAFETVEEMRNRFKDEYGGYLYSRGLNPTVDILRKKMAALEETEDALILNSGASAIFSAVVPFVKSGDHIISVAQPYTWAQKLFNELLPRFGVETTYVDGRNIDHFKNAYRSQTKLIYLESPNSWDFAIQDLNAVSSWAKTHGMLTVIDNSYCSPVYQQPSKFGIDLILHSATKYISGHSDTVAGVLCGKKAHLEKLFNLEYLTAGNGIQPFNAWLLLRGLRTLPMRLEHLSKSTRVLVDFMKNHPKVERVLFPLDPDFPQYDLARMQMNGACGLFSFVVKSDDPDRIEKFCNQLKHILKAVSWGGYESLIIPRLAGIEKNQFDKQNEAHRMIRMYVGLESTDYLIGDLAQAMQHL
ncbi:MAG: aminotransferase class I/II-fold pyridoxal phosphate-dependent enzyme [Saprospiraceae bacterium]|nr:aminotransferase class I/II-fold pyridoxal phosphate-dependent enzyme [Saprospiraceae bacterium]